ncbi:hypothetical protein MSG28_011530 [Choristoneura fumiferana]|uniref:Uncharacterized protein n=1 Tax=Choristoneura fumiferana TaxID=7141 RepID=A0ACC0JNS0_CHOFU|nr:hypothetical protein MSG28_011530 [Choristoneura fumiferana]
MVSDALQQITIGPPHPRERKSQRSGWSHSSGQAGHHHPSGVSSETELDAQYAQLSLRRTVRGRARRRAAPRACTRAGGTTRTTRPNTTRNVASESSEGSSDGETRRPRPLPPPPHHEPAIKVI